MSKGSWGDSDLMEGQGNSVCPLSSQPACGLTHSQHVMACTQYLARAFRDHPEGLMVQLENNCDLQAVEESLSRVVRHIRAVRMNGSSKIMRFPPEILSMIFKFVQDEDIELRKHYGQVQLGSMNKIHDFSSKWTSIAHVCRHWRAVALSCASLWTTVSTTYPCSRKRLLGKTRDVRPRAVKPEFLQECLDRSRQALISIQIQARDRRRPWEDSRRGVSLLPHIPRCQELHIYTYRGDSCTVLVNVPSAPHLKTLALHVYGASRVSSEDLPLLFQGNTTSVKHLAFSGYRGFSGQNFCNLQQFHICQQTWGSLEHLQRLLDALAANPLLEDLMFSHISFPTSDVVQHCSKRSLLPNLRRLVFHETSTAPLHTYIPFLLCLEQIPSRLALSDTHDHQSTTVVSGHLYKLLNSPDFSRIPFPQIDRVSILFHHDRFFDLICAGRSSAWYLCDFFRQEPPDTPVCAIPTVQQLWISFKPSYSTLNPTDPPTRLYWPVPDFRELFLDVRLHQPDGLQWFLDGLRQTDLAHTSLQVIHIHGVNDALWNPLISLARSRQMLGCPVYAVHFYLDSGEATEQERLLFSDWRQRAAQDLQMLEVVQFSEVAGYPRMTLPSVCALNESARWRWLDWTSLGDILDAQMPSDE